MKQKVLILLAICMSYMVTTQAQTTPTPIMIKVEGSTFTMGGEGEYDEKPKHSVTLSNFSIGKFEVTVAEYQSFCTATGRKMPEAPAWGWNDKHPMVIVNFDDANAYCNWLSEATGKNFRLPTEAEWEYASRGGNKSQGYIYSGSNDLDEVGWYSDNSGGQPQACGRKKANELGLYDMSGNVWEWCRDWRDEKYYGTGPTNNPKGPSSGKYRVNRGGCWYDSASNCRIAYRGAYTPPDAFFHRMGFRLVSPE